MLRIDNLTPGTTVTLRFNGPKSLGNAPWEEEFLFLGIEGSGDDRHARFTSDDLSGAWEAYRYNGHWAYGSSAERLSLIGINDNTNIGD
jgi:hypothetical protein